MARKAELDRQKREAEGLEQTAKLQQEAKVTRKESMQRQREALQLRSAEMLAAKPLEPKGGDLSRHEGALKGWKTRYFYVEDRVPLVLKIYKQYRAEAELLEEWELSSETVLLDDDGQVRWGAPDSAPDDFSSSSSSSISVSSLSLTGSPSKRNSRSGKPHSFALHKNGQSLRLSAESNDSMLEWLDHLFELLNKHHALVHAIVPAPLAAPLVAPGSPTSSKLHRKTSSGDSAKPGAARKSSRNSISISEEPDEVINPLEDEIVGQSFRNELFGQ